MAELKGKRSVPVLGGDRKVSLPDDVFGVEFREGLVHEVVVADQAARRRGTASAKNRSQVRGGAAKPWRQKGTGRARQGSIRSPQWRGGGAAFGPQPRHYIKKVNRKARQSALRCALSLHAGRDSLAAIEAAAFTAPKTKQAAELLATWPEPRPTLLILGDAGDDVNLGLSFRNLPRVTVRSAAQVGVADLLAAASVVATEPALDALAARARGSHATEEVA